MTRLLRAGLILFFTARAGMADDVISVKLTVTVRGVVTTQDAELLRKAIENVEGVKFKSDGLQPGEKGAFGHHFSAPFVLELKHRDKADIGAVAKAVAQVRTSRTEDLRPSLNLVLYTPTLQVQEGNVVELRSALKDVNGVDTTSPGSVGGVPSEGRFWVRLDPEGQAKLADIVAALQKAELNLKLEKP